MKNNPRAVFFDLGNVLVLFDVKPALQKFSELYKTSEESLWKELFTSDLERAYTKGEIGSIEFFKAVQKKFKGNLSFQEFEHIWNDIFWPNDGMEELVKKISKKYKLYLISNTNHMHFEFIRKKYPVLKHFDFCFTSHEVGHRKPEPEIYRHVLEKTGFSPKEVVYIDDVPEFVQSAQMIGIPSVVFQSLKQLEQDLPRFGIKI